MKVPPPLFVCILAAACAAATVRANVTPAPMFCEHAVLQQGMPVPVWGSADPGEEVTVSFLDQQHHTTADAQGKWMVHLKALHTPEAGVLKIKGQNSLAFNDVVAGEVWFCAGQSNMALTLKGVTDGPREIAEANYPQIREFFVPLKPSAKPEDFSFVRSIWKPCTPQHITEYTAVGYFFAREISRELNVPVGLINSSWGGTPIYPWIDVAVLETAHDLYARLLESKRKGMAAWPATQAKLDEQLRQWQAESDQAKAAGQPFAKPKPWMPGPPNSLQYMPAGLTNGMLHPLLPYAIRGALWYQGEANAEAGPAGAADYAQMQPLMIKNWRELWGEGDFPFYFVQLPNWNLSAKGDKNNETWAFFREAQARTVAAQPNVEMAVTIDIGESGTVHPHNKQAVGHRLALIAEANTYHKPVAWAAPMFRSMKVEVGGKVRVEFDHAEGLSVKGGGEPNNFVIAGEDLQFVPAEAKIEGGGSVVVSSPQVPAPVAVRYAWGNDPLNINLYNKAGLPAAPFRTDEGPGR